MKKIMKGLLVTLVLLITISIVNSNFNEKTITTSAKKYMEGNVEDVKGPRCSIYFQSKIPLFKTVYGNIVCYDENGFSDTNIDVSDINVNNFGFFTKIKLLSVLPPQTDDGKTYTWRIKLKGTFIGTFAASLNSNSVFDINGNSNIPSLIQKSKVSLW